MDLYSKGETARAAAEAAFVSRMYDVLKAEKGINGQTISREGVRYVIYHDGRGIPTTSIGVALVTPILNKDGSVSAWKFTDHYDEIISALGLSDAVANAMKKDLSTAIWNYFGSYNFDTPSGIPNS